MKLVRRIVAFSLAVIMIVLAPLQHTNAYVLEDKQSGIVADTANKNVITKDDILANNEAQGSTVGGVINAPGSLYQGTGTANVATNGGYTLTEIDWASLNIDLKLNKNAAEHIMDLSKDTLTAETLVPIIIEFDSESIIEANNEAEANAFTALKSDVLEMLQGLTVSRIENEVFGGEELEITGDFTWVMNGVATVVPYGSVAQIKEISGVRNVYFERTYEVADYEKNDEVSLHTVVDGAMIGREETWKDYGYTGKGMTIAVIDTGIDNDHPNFAALENSLLTEDSLTVEDIESVLTQLNAYEMYSKVSAEGLYYSTKIPFGFNYADYNMSFNHSNDNQGDHGTHVAGIAGANKIDGSNVVGVAPDAQLIIMKVFGAYGGGTTSTLITAIEDALILDVDVINMSIGANAGFTDAGDGFGEVYERIAETDTFLAISAGNAATSGEYNDIGTDTNKTSDPDNATIASPSTFTNAMSVASVNNTAYMADYMELNGQRFMYVESVYDGNSAMGLWSDIFGGQSLDYAMVGNLGKTLEDFTSANVSGKVAVVSRGETNFTEKYRLAEEAGAIAVIIYNNIEGEFGANLSGQVGTIPCVCVTKEIGELFASLEGKARVKVAAEQALFANADGYLMSSFSSWGVTPDLRLKPDITGPGGYIYSTLDGGGYGIMSGTSMASPNVAGLATLVKQYVDETFPDMGDAEKRAFINALLTSTAEPIVNENGIYFSPRQQGTGLANAHNAIATNAYLTVEDDDLPQANLFDDPDKTGEYEFEFTIHNFGTTKLWYGINTNAQTEGYYYDDTLEEEFISLTPVELSAVTSEDAENIQLKLDFVEDDKVNLKDIIAMMQTTESKISDDEMFRYDLNEDGKFDTQDASEFLQGLVGDRASMDEGYVTVEAGEELTVSVTVTLSDEDKEYMDAHFENGIYVEGYTVLTAYNGGTDLSLPYMGFYGDWTEAPMFDSGYFWEDDINYTQYPHILWTSLGGSNWFPGLNPYIDEEFDPNNMAISPNGDGYLDTIEDIYVSLMRNARNLKLSYIDADTGEIYYTDAISYVQKSTYFESYDMIIPYVLSWDLNYLFDFRDPYTYEPLPDGTDVIVRLEATPDYDAEVNNDFDVLDFLIHVDTQAPEIVESELISEDGKLYLDLTVADSSSTAAICVLSAQGTMVRGMYAAEKGEPGEALKNRIDVTGCGTSFMVVVADYAGNERGYYFTAEGNDPVIDTDKLYGYRIADEEILDDTLYGWLGIDKVAVEVPAEDRTEDYVDFVDVEVMSSEYYVDYALTAATYVDGYILAIDANDELSLIVPGYWDERHTIAKLDASYSQLTFDPSSGVLYAFNRDTYKLEKIDLFTLEVTTLTPENRIIDIKALAADDNGKLYGLSADGSIKEIDITTGLFAQVTEGEEVVDKVVANLPNPDYYRTYSCSMTYDSAEGVFYVADFYVVENMAAYSLDYFGTLCKVDPKDGFAVTEIGRIGGDSEIIGLLAINDRGYKLDKDIVPTGVTLSYNEMVIVEGYSKLLTAIRTPWYSQCGEFEWISSNEEVATVDESGNVTALELGTTTITVNVKVEGEIVATASCEVEVIYPDVDLEGYSIYGNYNYNWISFNATDLGNYRTEKLDYNIYMAGEYYDGYVYAYTQYGEFYKINADTREAIKIADSQSKWSFYDMAYDYKNGWMYGIALDLVAYEYCLVRVDILTGDVEKRFAIVDEYGGAPITLAIDTDGAMYTVTTNGFLCKINLISASLKTIGFTGYYPSQSQSMTWDHNKGGVYWSYFDYYGGSTLLYLDVKTGETTAIGKVNGESWITAMYSRIDAENIPSRKDVAVKSVTVKSDTFVMIEGTTVTSPVKVTPYNATDRTITYVVEDPTILEVVDGRFYGKSTGITSVTATAGDYSVTFDVKVKDSVGKIRGFIVADLIDGSGWFWGEFEDQNLSTGTALAVSNDCIYAAEFYDGNLYAYIMNEETSRIEFVVQTIDTETFECYNKVVGSFDFTQFPDLRDMAIDCSEASMYAIAGVRNGDGNTSLYNIDTTTGNMFLLGEMSHTFVGLTCSTDGTLYGVTVEGDFYEIDKTDGSSTFLFSTGYVATTSYQSMTYDHDTGNIYWAHLYYTYWEGQDANLVLIDVEEEEAISIGKIGTMGCQVTGLHIPTKHVIQPADKVVERILLDSTYIMLPEGEQSVLSASTYPIQIGKSPEFTFSSSDTSVVTVDENGLITAVGAGVANITVECDGVVNECRVAVIGDNYTLKTLNTDMIGTSVLLEQEQYSATVEYSDEDFVLYSGDYSEADGCYYAIDEAGYFYRVSEDGTVEQIGTQTLIGQFDNVYTNRPNVYEFGVNDLVVNKYNGKVYGIAQYYEITNYDEATDAYTLEYTGTLFTVDTTTGEIEEVGTLLTNKVTEMDFISETEVIYYDGLLDYLCCFNLNVLDEETGGFAIMNLAWLQVVLSADNYGRFGMEYCEELDTVFMITPEYNYDTQRYAMAIYAVDMNTKYVKKICDVPVHSIYNLRDICIFKTKEE